MGKSFIWDGEKAVEQEEPTLIWDGTKAVPVKKKGSLASLASIGRKALSSGQKESVSEAPSTLKQPLPKIEDYNKAFEEATGHKEFSLSEPVAPGGLLSQDLYQQRKKEFDLKKYETYRGIEENEINPVKNGVFTGTIEPQKLKELYSKPYGKKIVGDIINSEVPELGSLALEGDTFGNEQKWEVIAKGIQDKNRLQGIESVNQEEFNLDNEIYNDLKNYQYGYEMNTPGNRAGENKTIPYKNVFGEINTSSPEEIQGAIDKIEKNSLLWDAEGNKVDKTGLLKKLNNRLFQLKASENVHPDILKYKDEILNVVKNTPVEWKKGGVDEQSEIKDAEYLMSGINYIRDTKPGEYNAIMATVAATGKMSETQYTELATLGKDLQYYKDFKEGKYVKQDKRSFLTPQLKKANLAGWLSENLSDKGFRNRAAYSQKEILEAYKDAPEEIKDDQLIRDIINAERAPSFGFLPIPQGEGLVKKGGLTSAMRGLASPIQSIFNTVETNFDSPFDAYLKSKRFDIGDPTIINKKGKFSKTLDDNFWNKAVEGSMSMLVQVALARGIGNLVKTPLNAVIGRVDPRAAVTTGQAALNIGTPISTLAQTYGDEYLDFLEKKGSPTKASLGAFASGLAQGLIERFVMPDVKIADKIELLASKRNFAKEVINVIDNGGGKTKIGELVKDFLVNTGKTLGKEAWGEEVLQNAVNYATEAIISPKTAKDRDLVKESIDTGLAATTAMLIPSLLGGGGETRAKRQMTRAQLNMIAGSPQQFLEALDRQLAIGNVSQQDYDLSTQIINLHRDNILNSPKYDNNGELISAERQLEYAYQSTVQNINQQKADAIKDPIQREPIEKKIKEADDIKRKIFYGEEDAELPSKEGADIEVEPELSPAEMKAVKIAATEPLPGMYQEMLDTNPTEVIKEIAQQAQGISADGTPLEGGSRTQDLLDMGVSKTFIDAAIEAYPTQKKGEPEQISEPIELSVEASPVSVEGEGNINLNEKEKSEAEEFGLDKDGVISVRNVFSKPSTDKNLPNVEDAELKKFLNDENNSTKETVKISELVPTQNILDKASIKEGSEKPFIIKDREGRYLIVDGHHKIANEALKGVVSIEVPIFDISKMNYKTYEESQSGIISPETTTTIPDQGGVPPIEGVTETTTTDEGGKKKSTLTRLYQAKNMPEGAKKAFEKEGFDYVPSSQEEANQIAKSTIDELGIDEAVNEAAKGTFGGGVNSLIFGEALNRLAEKESDAKKWAEVAIQYDKFNRVRGQDISAINYFYKKSPLGVILKENADRKTEFEQWSKPKDKSWSEFFDELMKEPDFKDIVDKKVQEERKKERAAAREKRVAKVREVFKKAKVSKGQAYASIIPPSIWNGAVDLMEQLYLAGEEVVSVVQQGIDYISKELNTEEWDKDKFREKWEKDLKESYSKKELTPEELKTKVLDKFRKKLKGLSETQKDEVIRRAYKQLIENGALEYDEFKQIIARVTRRGELTEDEKAKLKDLTEKTNAATKAAEVAQNERTAEALDKFYEAQVVAGRAARDLRDIFRSKPDIVQRLTSIMQLNTLGLVALVNNPVYNFWNQLGLRYPIGLINDTIDRTWGAIGRAMGKPSVQEYNVWESQKEFWSKLGSGAGEAFEQIRTGLNRQDYTQKEVYGQQIRPFKALRDLKANLAGKKPLTKAQFWDKVIEGTVGIPAETVARLLNVGDKPMRFAAEGAQASSFAKAMGLKEMDYKLFIEFPREEAYRAFKAQGLSDEVAGQKADYVKEAIEQEGKRSTFQQDNLLNDAITRAAAVVGGKDSGTANLTKALVISPYIKIPSNAFWSAYNLINPEVAFVQAMVHAGIAKKMRGKGEITKAQLQNREARYWLAHAMVGIGWRAVIIALVNAGLFTPTPDDEDSKKERDARSQFDKAGTMQIGDLKVSNRWLGLIGVMGNAIAQKHKDMTPEQRENQDEFWNIAFGLMEFEALKELENGIFANSSSLLQSVSTGDFSRYGINTLNLFTNIIQPATAAQLNRASLDYIPSGKGDTFLEKLNQNFAQRSTLYRKIFDVQLNYKRDMWGERIPRDGNVLSKMFGITKGDPKIALRPVYEDYMKSGNSGYLPPSIMPTLNGQKLNTEQYDKLQMYIGEERKKLVEPFVSNNATIKGQTYKTMNEEDKLESVTKLYRKGYSAGKEKFLKDYPTFKKQEE